MKEGLVYEEIPNFGKRVVKSAIKNDDVEVLRLAALSAAILSGDGTWAEGVCYKLVEHTDPNVRGNALLSLGHIARVHGKLDRQRAIKTFHLFLEDENEFVRNQAQVGMDDVKWFIKRDGTPRFAD